MQNIAIYVIIIKKKGIKMEKKDSVINDEKKSNILRFGSATHPIKLKKEDFLIKRDLTKKFSTNNASVQKVLDKIYKNNISLIVNGHKVYAVVFKTGSRTMQLHPLALDIFQDYLERQKD